MLQGFRPRAGAALMIAALTPLFLSSAPWVTSADGQAPATEPENGARTAPFQRRPLPPRPGFPRGRPPQFRRPGTTPPKTARFAMEVTGAKHVAGAYRSEIFTTRSPVKEWEVCFPVAVELARQKDVRSSTEPESQLFREASRAHRPVLRTSPPIVRTEAPQIATVSVRYEATLLARKLIAIQPGRSAPVVMPLSFNEDFVYLGPSPTLDFRAAPFQSWLDKNELRRENDEDEIDFAKRVFGWMVKRYTYRDGIEPTSISTLCERDVLDCDTLSLVFVGTLRASGVPARVLYGWPLRPLRHLPGRPLSGHTQAEFYAEGVGWVPVDISYGILHRDDDPMLYFGEDRGDLLIVQIDPDYIVPHPNGMAERIVSMHPGPSVWARGDAKPDTAIRPLGWDVEVSPSP